LKNSISFFVDLTPTFLYLALILPILYRAILVLLRLDTIGYKYNVNRSSRDLVDICPYLFTGGPLYSRALAQNVFDSFSQKDSPKFLF
jgi:hypothetical protein